MLSCKNIADILSRKEERAGWTGNSDTCWQRLGVLHWIADILTAFDIVIPPRSNLRQLQKLEIRLDWGTLSLCEKQHSFVHFYQPPFKVQTTFVENVNAEKGGFCDSGFWSRP